MKKFSIITIHKGPISDLTKTIKSVMSQKKKPFKHIIITPSLPNYFKLKYKKKFIKFVVGKDKSIYNAMNIGLNLTFKENILFLNSGDIFFDKNCTNIINNAINKNPTTILIYKVILRYKENFYFPKKKYFLSDEYLPHPGFVRPALDSKKKIIRFNETFETISDGLWMKKNTKKFNLKKINKNIVIHGLGGVSTIPTIKLILEKKKLSRTSYYKELLKLFLIHIFGKKYYYKILYFKKFQNTFYEKR